MAFEDWCFKLFAERYPTSENELDQCVVRGDDFNIDVIFEFKETEEIYILQCKHPKISANDPIPEDEVKSFFAIYALLRDHQYLDQRNTSNPKIAGLGDEFDYWRKQNFTINFIFISSGKATDKTSALVEKYNRDYQNQGVQFDVWDISRMKDEFVAIKSVEAQYPDLVTFSLADDHYMIPDGEHENITFVIKGTRLKEIAVANKDSLFNWNIRRFLGKKGEVNSGLTETLEKEPENFFYYNNGISALCEEFEFNQKSKELKVRKLQIVNGAQTIGAIKNASNHNLGDVLVLVKLTAIKHASREKGIAAGLIKTNNTQNKLREPDFRSNDRIQQWLELQFKNTKPRGDMIQIAYGRKRPYPRVSSNVLVLKLQDLGKIRYAWYQDPRIPIASPARLFQLHEDGGLYGFAFGSADGEMVDVWTDSQFRECLLAIHTYNKINSELHSLQEANDDLKQLTRLRYYGLKLFKSYFDQMLPTMPAIEMQNIYQFGAKYDLFFARPKKIICHTLTQSYRDILKQNEGTAFSLPRDAKVWDLVRTKFEDNLALIREVE